MSKKFKGMVEALEKVAGEQKRVTGALLERLKTITENLIEIVENHDLTDHLERFDYRGYGFRRKGSAHGKWIYFCKVEEYSSKILPAKPGNISSGFYYHNDLNYWTEYMSRDDVLLLCEILPEFIQNMSSKIENLTDKEQKFLNKFAKEVA